MKIKSVRIENFRSFQDETIELGDYSCLVGPNGAGKSTVLNALNIFFRESKSSPVDLLELSKEDFHCSDTSKPIRVTVTFVELSESAEDALKDYVRHDQLVVMAVAQWSEESQTAPVVQKGLRLAMAEFAPFFKALNDGKPVADLKNIYSEGKRKFPELPAPGTKAAMTEAMRAYETAHVDKCVLIESDDEFYGVSKGAHKLGAFIQWIYE
jgi:putative ATP-dependent endonuclease of OLD family